MVLRTVHDYEEDTLSGAVLSMLWYLKRDTQMEPQRGCQHTDGVLQFCVEPAYPWMTSGHGRCKMKKHVAQRLFHLLLTLGLGVMMGLQIRDVPLAYAIGWGLMGIGALGLVVFSARSRPREGMGRDDDSTH